MKKIDSPSLRDRFISKRILKRAILFSILIHLFVMIAVPAYSVRAFRSKPEKLVVRLQYADGSRMYDPRLYDPWKENRWPLLLPEITDEMLVDDSEMEVGILNMEKSRPSRSKIPKLGVFAPYDERPIPIYYSPPEYPELAIMLGIEGTVYTHILVGEDGCVCDVVISKGLDIFHEAATKCVKQARFRPAIYDNRPVAHWMVLPIIFSLRNWDYTQRDIVWGQQPKEEIRGNTTIGLGQE